MLSNYIWRDAHTIITNNIYNTWSKEMPKLTWVMDLTYIIHTLRKFQHLGHGRSHIIQELRKCKCKNSGVPNCRAILLCYYCMCIPPYVARKQYQKSICVAPFRVVITWAHSSKHGECVLHMTKRHCLGGYTQSVMPL